MSVLDSRPALKAAVWQVAETAGYLWTKGWAERNGGNITVNGLGDSEVTVIPTYNTRLWQKIIIKVRQPNVRLYAAAKMRLSKNGTIRIS